MSEIECPQCKSPEAMEDFYYKSGETCISCPACGYVYRRERDRDNNTFKVTEIKAKGCIILAGILFKCPECGQETCPRENKCANCEYEFSDLQVSDMLRRKKVSPVHTVYSIAPEMSEADVEELKNLPGTVIIKENYYG